MTGLFWATKLAGTCSVAQETRAAPGGRDVRPLLQGSRPQPEQVSGGGDPVHPKAGAFLRLGRTGRCVPASWDMQIWGCLFFRGCSLPRGETRRAPGS